MAAMGFGPGAQQWVPILHTGTTARVAFKRWHTDEFPVASGPNLPATSRSASRMAELLSGRWQSREKLLLVVAAGCACTLHHGVLQFV
jgi:hypothetical protein